MGKCLGLPSVGPALFVRGEAEAIPAAARAMMDWESFMIRQENEYRNVYVIVAMEVDQQDRECGAWYGL